MANSGSGSGGGAGAIRAGRAFVQLFADNNPLIRGLGQAEASLRGFGKKLLAIGGPLLAGPGGLFAGAVAALKEVSGEVGQIGVVGAAFGLTAEKASQLFGILRAAGSDTRDATEGLVTLGERVKDALSGSGKEAQELFAGLGVSAQSFAGLDPAEQFFKLHEALLAVKDPAQRVQLLLKAVGEDTGKNLIATLSRSTEQLRASGKQFTITAGEMDTARKASAAYNRVSASLANAWQRVVLAVAQAVPFDTIADALVRAIGAARDFVAQNAAIIRTVLLVGGAAGAAGAALVGLGVSFVAAAAAIGPVVVGLKLAGQLLLGVVAPLALTAAALGYAGYAWVTYTQTGQAALAALLSVVNNFAGTVRTVWGGMADALSVGNLGLAADIAATGVMIAYEKVAGYLRIGFGTAMDWMRSAWASFTGYFAGLWQEATGNLAANMVTVKEGILSALVDLGAAFRQFGAGVMSVFGSGLGRVIGKIVSDALAILEKGAKLVGATSAANTLAGLRQGWDHSRWFAKEASANIEAERQASQAAIRADADAARAELEKQRQELADAAAAGQPVGTAGRQAADEAVARVAELENRLARLTAEAAAQAAAKPTPAAEVAKAAQAAAILAGETSGGNVSGGFGSLGARFGAGDKGIQAVAKNTAEAVKELKLNREALEALEGAVYR